MFFHIVSTENSKLLKIENIGFSTDPKNNKFGPGRRNLYLIHYVFSGKGYFNGNYVGSGQGFLIRPNTHEYYYPDTKDPWGFLWITSTDSAMEEIFAQLNADKKTQIFDYNYIPAILSLAKQIKQNHNKNYCASKILEVFLNLFNQHKISKESKRANMYFRYAENYIRTNVYRTVHVSELVNILGITQPYLYKIFKNNCGMSPKQYIDNHKVNIAKKMLLEDCELVSEIGHSLGFEDPLVFSRFFKRNVGISPTKFSDKHYKSQP